MMEVTRQITLPESTHRHLLGCKDEMTDLFLRKFSCEVELRGPKPGGYSAPSIKPEMVYEKRTVRGPVVSVWKGDLTRQDADVVVNAANEDLRHAGGLAHALVEAGGPIIVKDSKDYIKANGPLKTGQCVVTRPGNLPCKCLLHAVGPVWFSDAAARCESELAECIRNVLQYVAQHKDIRSVAIPAISSGIFGFPLQKCAEIIVKTIHSFCSSVTQTHVQEIRLVNDNDPAVQAMKSACQNIFGRSDDLSAATSASGSQTRPVTRSMATAQQPSSSAPSNMTVYGQPPPHRSPLEMPQPITINGLTLHLVQGFIQEQNTAVIVNSLGTDLKMNAGQISSAILQKAGYELQREVNNQAQYYGPYSPLPIMIPTSGWRLSCAFVYHVFLQSDYRRTLLDALAQATTECLNTAHHNNCPSISFPALGTGNVGLSRNKVAQVMVDTVIAFASGRRCSMHVYMVIHPQDRETYRAFQDQWNSKDWNRNTNSGAKERDPRPDVHGKSSELPDVEIPCLIIRGTSDEDVEEAEAWLTNVLHPQPVSIQNNLVLLFGKEEHDLLSSPDFPEVTIEEKLSNGTSVVKIDGLPQDKIRAVIEVERLLIDVQEKHAVLLEEELLEAAVIWFYENKSRARRYPAKANRELERAYVTQSDITLKSEPRHVICMKNLTAEGKDGAFQLQRRTIADSSKNGQKKRRPEDFLSHVVPVDANSQEFKDHENRFKKEKLTLVKMERIHNRYLAEIFQYKKGVKQSEKKTCRVYQLVPRQFTGLVCDVGFQRIFSNPKDTRLGQGIYFTDSPRRALECFQTPEEEGGLLHIFQAEVLTDSSAANRDHSVLVPKKSPYSSKPDNISDLCDSLVNSTISPTIYVIPDSFQANPLYLFTCRRQGVNSSLK